MIDDITCPECKKLSLSKHFDGEQTYVFCKEPDCNFDSLYGDGDLTKKLDTTQ